MDKTPASPRATGHVNHYVGPEGLIPEDLENAIGLDIDNDDDDDDEEADVDMEDADNLDVIDTVDEESSRVSEVIKREINNEDETPVIDFTDPIEANITPVNPFGSNNKLSSSKPVTITIVAENRAPLNDKQVQRLLNYLDNKLMTIQRSFVQFLSKNDDAPKWQQLVLSIDELIEFIWFSVTGIKRIIGFNHLNVYDFKTTKLKINSSRIELPSNMKLNGCEHYLITLMGEIINYIVKYNIDHYDDWLLTLQLLGKIDDMICIFIDYGGLISQTDKIRINSIVQRTKIVIIQLFERFSNKSVRESDEIHFDRNQIDNFQIFVGEVYEGLSDRTSI